ncbi:hypothetical protein B0O99DRAFT_655246 [Bisporella sp. PMI_857]|nr:hypothetical protein B0O99DRAFT_655246 [Bisporella sp. PMI_857]
MEPTLAAFCPTETYLSNYTPLALLWVPGPLFGGLVNTYGPALVLYPGAFLCVFSLCMTSLATEFYQIFLAQRLVFGTGAGAIFTGSSFGGVIYPFFLNKVIQDVDFPGALLYAALVMGILLVAPCFMIQAWLPREKWDSNTKLFDPTLFKDKQFALYTAGTWLFVPIPGRILPPYLGDRNDHFNVITTCAFLQAATIAIAVVYGPVSGVFISLMMPCLFGSVSAIGSTGLLTASTFFLLKTRKTWKI